MYPNPQPPPDPSHDPSPGQWTPPKQPMWSAPLPPQPPQGWPPVPPPKPKHKIPRLVWIILGIAVVISMCSGAVQGIQKAATATPVPLTIDDQPTEQPTAAIQPTATPIPRPTPKPTPRPLSTAQRAVQIATNAAPLGTQLTATYDATGEALRVGEYLDTNTQLSSSTILFSIKHDCFVIQQALWQAKLAGVSLITLTITAPLQDQYGNVQKGELAYCTLMASTAAKFNWSHLLAEEAWPLYDRQWYLPSLDTSS